MSDLNRFKNNPFLSELPFVNIAKARRRIDHQTGNPEFVETPDEKCSRKWLRNYTRYVPVPYNHSRPAAPDYHREKNRGVLKEEHNDLPETLPRDEVIETPPNMIGNLVQIPTTPYYRFDDSIAYSYGPSVIETPIVYESLHTWRARQTGQNISIDKLDGSVWSNILEIPIGTSERLVNISLTFEHDGTPAVTWNIPSTEQIYLYWKDPADSTMKTINIAAGHSPFISMSTFDLIDDPNAEIYLVYIDDNGTLVHRNQSDDYDTAYDIEQNVLSILGFGQTVFDNVKIVYVRSDSVGPTIRSVSTVRRGV